MKFVITLIISLSSLYQTSLANESQVGFSIKKTCTRNEYREKYYPGTRDNPGYVERWEETVEVPCTTNNSSKNIRINQQSIDQNDCSEGTIAGGLLGGGIATAISRGKGRWWAIPVGIVSGSLVGCEIDGG